MVRGVLFALGVVVLLGSAGQAQPADPIKTKLDKAKAAYDGAVEKVQAGVHKSLDEREATARKAGDKKLVDLLKAEREAFDARGVLPTTVPTANYLRDAKAARTALELAYATAVKEYVKARKDDEAAAAEKDLAAFRDATGDAGVSLSALLTKGSVWSGVRRVATDKGKISEMPFQLKVTTRDGKAFSGEITLDKTRKYDVVGNVEGDKLGMTTEKKGKFKNTFDGRLRGKVLELVFGGTGNGGDEVKGIVVLTPAKGK